MSSLTYDEITNTITREQGEKLGAQRRAYFEAFNPNGAMAAKRAADRAIDEAVDAGALKPGAILAYGALNNWHEDKLMAQVRRKRAVAWDVHYHAKALREQAARATQIAAEAMAGRNG